MRSGTASDPSTISRAKSVQAYIDETPSWPDGTSVSSAPMTSMQWRIWTLAAAGKFFEGLVVFMTGVAMPLIADEFHITAAQHGVVGAASLSGILVGAIGLGGLSDFFGRKVMFASEMIIFMVFLVLLVTSSSYISVVIFLFGIGVALGCDYPTAHLIISESIPSSVRGRLVLGAFGFQALGALTGTAVGYLVLRNIPDIGAWRWMYATAIIPALVVTVGRFYITESAPWLFSRGRVNEAEQQALRLLRRSPIYPKEVKFPGTEKREGAGSERPSYALLFNKANGHATILAAVPWFLQDLGIIFAVLLADKVGRIVLQVFGFIGCAAGLLLASFSASCTGGTRIALIFAGFMLFNFMTNVGPNAQTYLLAGEVFPTRVRGMGAGFAAAFAKIGAVTTAFPVRMIHYRILD